MSLRSLESAIASEARLVFKNQKIRVKDIIEWRTAEIQRHDGEVVTHLPLNGVWVAIESGLDKRIALARSPEEATDG